MAKQPTYLIYPRFCTGSIPVRPIRVKNRLGATSSRGKALCLLKTQYAKKPKNPV
jgi:hypothetical protein